MGKPWKNHTGNQVCHPRAFEPPPKDLAALIDMVQRAERAGTTVRIVGAHHSWSDVALTDGLLAEPWCLRGLLPLDDGCLRPPKAGSPPLVRVLSGTPLWQLNPVLWEEGLSLPNAGGYDAQTLAGVVSTSTHGSGIAFGPFPDLVESLDLVVARGEVVRVEPEDGITDPEAFAAAHGDARSLIQDTGTFRASQCGIGSMGLIHSFVIAVRDRFYLDETRETSTWEEVRRNLGKEFLAGEEHYELFLNPYARKDGRHSVLVTRRREISDPEGRPRDKRQRHPLTEIQSAFPGTWALMQLGARVAPKLIASRFEWLLRTMCDDGYADPAYKVFNIGEANKIPAYSSELAVSLEDDRHLHAIDRILVIAAREKRFGRIHTSPIALRFVAPSDAYASMMHERPTMMIELILAKGTRHGFDLLSVYERELADLGVRPHWGQVNDLSSRTDFGALYDRWDEWLAVYQAFNATGVFNSPFTDRLGISVPSS